MIKSNSITIQQKGFFMTTEKHVGTIKPFIFRELEHAIKAGSGALDDLNKMLDLAKKNNDAALIDAIEARISSDASRVKDHFSNAIVAVANELGLPVQVKPSQESKVVQATGKKQRKQRIVVALSADQKAEGEKNLPKVLKVLPKLDHANKVNNLGMGKKDEVIAGETGLTVEQVKLARRVGQEQGKIASKGVWGGAFKV
jgi:hypothetical protein